LRPVAGVAIAGSRIASAYRDGVARARAPGGSPAPARFAGRERRRAVDRVGHAPGGDTRAAPALPPALGRSEAASGRGRAHERVARLAAARDRVARAAGA